MSDTSVRDKFDTWYNNNAEKINATQIGILDKRFSDAKKLQEFLYEKVDIYEEEFEYIETTRKKEVVSYLSEKIRETLTSPQAQNPKNTKNSPQKEVSKESIAEGNTLLEYIAEHCIYVNALESDQVKDSFFLDMRTGERHPATIAAVKALIPPKVDVKFHKFKTPHINAFVEYNPFFDNRSVLPNAEIGELIPLTTYRHPQWRKDGVKPELDPTWLKFFELFVPNEECRNFLYRWIFRSLTSVCPQHLVLVGKQGIGKGVLISELMSQMHGPDNFQMGKNNTLTTAFNPALSKCTLFFLDEVEVKSELRRETLKLWANPTQAIEDKGVSVRQKKRTASVVLAANYLNSIFIDPTTSRKFLVLDLTPEKLLGASSKEWIEKLITSFKCPQKQAGFFQFLQTHHSEGDEFEHYMGETFQKMSYHSAPESLRYVLKAVMSKEKKDYDIQELLEGFSKNKRVSSDTIYNISEEYLTDFFEAFRWEGKKIAKVEKGRVIPINEFEFEPKSTIVTGENVVSITQEIPSVDPLDRRPR